MKASNEDGSILPLTLVYGILSLVLILVVVAATSLYVERKRLFSLADGASLVGAEAFELDQVRVDGDALRASLQPAAVGEAVGAYLADNPIGHFEGLRVVNASTADGQSATVTLAAYWRPPVLSLFVPDGFPLQVTSVARSVFY
ncbi:MAG: pilus assembly protein TadG-related protein [Microbacteriaceae bacterium]